MAQPTVGGHTADMSLGSALMEKLACVGYPTDNEPGRAYLAREITDSSSRSGQPILIRRQFVFGAAVFTATTPTLMACSFSASHGTEDARNLRHAGAVNTGDRPQLLLELVRYATLAPSSHNTQCWKFRVQGNLITIEPDLSRRCPVVDPDDHHMFVSLGCATENLAHAALTNGIQVDARFDTVGTGAVSVRLNATRAVASPHSRRDNLQQ